MALSNTAVPKHYGIFRDAVLRGEIPVNENISMQMNIIDKLIEHPSFYYDDEAIDGFEEFCECEMTTAEGDDLTLLPTFLLWAEDLLAWYYFSEEKVYNHVKKRYEMVQIKRRLRNKQYLIVSRGNAKSIYAGLIQAYGIVVDTQTTHQVVTAPTMKQAEETLGPIRTALARARGPLLSFLTEGDIRSNTWSKVKLASTKKGIENFLTNSLLEIRTMSVSKLQGMRSKYNTVDEWLSGDIKEDVIGALEQGASKVIDYIILATSSEGTVRDGVGDTIKMELQSILRGTYYDPHTSIWHYCLDSLSEISDPEMWIKANPNIGATVSYEAIQRDVNRAESNPQSRNDIIAKRFGIPVEGYTYFFLYEETHPHRYKSYDGMLCSLGADMSQGDDFCAFTFIFPLGNGWFGVKTRSYVCEHKIKKLPSAMQLKYDKFIKEGTLIPMDAIVLDMMDVYEDMMAHIIEHNYGVMAFGYDPYNAKDFVNRYMQENSEYGVTKVIQGVRTESVPLGELKILANERRLLFDEELFKFSMENTVVLEDNNGNRKLSKKRAEDKIDNVAAGLDAWIAYKRNQEAFM